MAATAPASGSERARSLLNGAAAACLLALVLWPAATGGAHEAWPLAATQLLALAGLLAWVLGMLARRRLRWRRTPLDLPGALLILLVLAQVAVGNRGLAGWALAPPAPDPGQPIALPTPLAVGTVSPDQTVRSLLLFLTYAAAYVLVVNLLRSRADLDRLVRWLVGLGGALAFLGLIDYLSGEAWLLRWRAGPAAVRLTGPFANPDHFAAWLAMAGCLGVGWLAARRGPPGTGGGLWTTLAARSHREAATRRHLPFLGVALIALGLVFTLSRGAFLALAVTLGVALAALDRSRRRWLLLLLAGLGAVVLAYAAGIGLGPVAERLRAPGAADRLAQWGSSLPMLGAFPLLGVGLGAYKDIYFRFQPAGLDPGRVFFPYAHNDLLQWVLEVGPAGALLAGWAAWRVWGELLRPHLRGQGPRAAGGAGARRGEAGRLAIGFGALAAVSTLTVHSLVDFGARIPAVGILGAAALGIATVTLQSRATRGGGEPAARARSRLLAGRWAPLLAGAGAVGAAGLGALLVVRPAVVATLTPTPGAPDSLARVERALRLDPDDARLRALAADLRSAAAASAWLGAGTDEERRARALALLDGAAADVRAALALEPSSPFLHERLARVHATAAGLDPGGPAAHRALALAHARRAMALAPENPYLARTLVLAALSGPEPRVDLALAAARAALERDPALLPEMLDRLLPAGPPPARWAALVPDRALDRFALARLLETRGLLHEAQLVYRRALEGAAPAEEPLFRWTLARLLAGTRRFPEALRELDAALVRDPANPELHLARAEALTALGEPAALEAFRAAAAAHGQTRPFAAAPGAARELASLGEADRPARARYARALARQLSDRRLWPQALVEWDRVLAERADDAPAHFGRGTALEALGRPGPALEAYRRAVALDGSRAEYRLRLAERFWENQQYYEAIAEWRGLLGHEPGNLQARLALARAHARVGDRDEAARQYHQVLLAAPGNAEARRFLGERLQ